MTADRTSRTGDPTGPAAGAGAAHTRAVATAPDPRGAGAPTVARRAGEGTVRLVAAHPPRPRERPVRGAQRRACSPGGIAYAALFSVFAALTIAYTIFMAVLGNNDELRQTVLDAL